jgi:hypothetical protein
MTDVHMRVAIHRVTMDHQEQPVGVDYLREIVKPEHFEKATAYLTDCGHFYYQSGDAMLLLRKLRARDVVSAIADFVGVALMKADYRVTPAMTTTGSILLKVTDQHEGERVNITFTSAREK